MLAKLDFPANYEVGLMAAITGAACRGSKEECESDSRATFHMSHPHARMTAYEINGKRWNEAAQIRSKTPEVPPPPRRADVGESSASAGMRSILLTSTMVCARVLNTRLAIVRSEELRRTRY